MDLGARTEETFELANGLVGVGARRAAVELTGGSKPPGDTDLRPKVSTTGDVRENEVDDPEGGSAVGKSRGAGRDLWKADMVLVCACDEGTVGLVLMTGEGGC